MSEELDKPITLPDREPDEVTVEDDEGVRRTVRLWREPGGVGVFRNNGSAHPVARGGGEAGGG